MVIAAVGPRGRRPSTQRSLPRPRTAEPTTAGLAGVTAAVVDDRERARASSFFQPDTTPVAARLTCHAGGQPDSTGTRAHQSSGLRPPHWVERTARRRPLQCPTLFLKGCHWTRGPDADDTGGSVTLREQRRARPSTGWPRSSSTQYAPQWRARSATMPVGLARWTDGRRARGPLPGE